MVFLAVFFVPQIPVRRRIGRERDSILAKLSLRKETILASELSSSSFDELQKIFDVEKQIIDMGLGLSATRAFSVKIWALVASMSPFASTLAERIVNAILAE